MLQQLIAMADCMTRPPRFYHYRDRDKTEVDIVIESRKKIWGVEIKAGASVSRDDVRGLLKVALYLPFCFSNSRWRSITARNRRSHPDSTVYES